MPTSNPVPSADPSDLVFNAEALDKALNSDSPNFTDRLGRVRQSVGSATAAVTAASNTAVTVTIPARVADVTAAANAAVNVTIPAALATVDAKVAAINFAAKDTIAIGRASVVDGSTFWVRPNATDGLTRYTNYLRTSSTTQTFVADTMTGTEFDSVIIKSAPDGLYFQDSAGRVGARLDSSGTFEVPSVKAPGVTVGVGTFGSVVVSDGTSLSASSGKVTEITDASSRVIYDMDSAGKHRMVSAEIGTVAAKDALILRQFRSVGDKRSGAFRADINHILYYGQSWSLGFDSQPALNTTQLYDTLTFNGGVRQLFSVASVPTALQSFVPAVESNITGSPEFPTSALGETGAVAMANTIKELILAENNLAHTDHNFQILVSAPGEGSKQLEQLADNAQPYILRLKEQVSRGYAIAQALGKSYNVLALTWIQGSGASVASYPERLEAMRLDIDTYVKSVTGQTNDVKLISWQQYPNTNTQSGPGSATSVYSRFVGAADNYPHIVIAAPAYQYLQVSASNVHYRNLGMAEIGKDLGFALKRAVIDGADFEPLRPLTLTRQGVVATLKMNVSAGRLIEDVDQVSTIANDGFNLYNSAGVLLTISSVTITGPDTIRIVAASTIPAGATLRYADTGTDLLAANKWRGNIRDNLAEIGQRNRWLVAFSFPFSN